MGELKEFFAEQSGIAERRELKELKTIVSALVIPLMGAKVKQQN